MVQICSDYLLSWKWKYQQLIKLKGDEAKTYKLTKSLGIKYCSEMIKPYENWVEVFNQHKKKDDLADSFLQGMYYFNEMM